MNDFWQSFWFKTPTIPSKNHWKIVRNSRSSNRENMLNDQQIDANFKEASVVSEEAPIELHGNEIFYASLAITGVVLLLLLIIIVIVFFQRKRNKISDDEQATTSILVYPSQQGNQPQFLTKEIHFSLPSLRSTSMGDLSAEPEINESEIDSDCLLLPSLPNQRSNSFSCYGLGVIEPALYRNTLDLDEIQWPEGHIGRIWFSLRYEPSTEKLLVSLLKAKNLPSRTVGTVNSCDPFVRLHLMPDERRYLQSKQKKKTCNPYFDETLVFQVSAKDMSDHVLKLTVIDGNRTKRHSEIGHVTFPLKNLEIGDGTEQQLFKLDLEKEPQEIKSNLGELLISLAYNENMHRLTASVIEAKGIKKQARQRTKTMTPVESEPTSPVITTVKTINGYHNNSTIINTNLLYNNNNNNDNKKNKQTLPEELLKIARNKYNRGETRSINYRKQQLRQLLHLIEEHCDDLIDAVYKDIRKPRHEVIIAEIELIANDLRHTLMKIDQWSKPKAVNKRLINLLEGVYIYNDPYGVVLIIGAWNYPVMLTLGPLVGAIAGGNCAILKPSELSPVTADLLSNLLPQYLDPEAYHVYLGAVPETVALLEQRFDYIFFTGSTAIGKIVHQAAAQHLTPTTLELGGKSPVYIDESADILLATRRILWGKCLNAGQTCISPDYILCTRKIQMEFLEKAKDILKEFYGDDVTPPENLSKIITERHFKRLMNFIETNKIAIGGRCYPNQLKITPTILIDVDPNDAVMQEEIFGPILPIINVKNVEEAVDFINKRDKPLSLYLFTKNRKVRDFILENTSSGGVTVNDTIMHVLTENLPFGGVGGSGMGGYHSKYGFETFTHRKSVLIRGLNYLSELRVAIRYPPYTNFKTQLLTSVLKKRRGISMKFVKNLLIFIVGISFGYILHKFIENN